MQRVVSFVTLADSMHRDNTFIFARDLLQFKLFLECLASMNYYQKKQKKLRLLCLS